MPPNGCNDVQCGCVDAIARDLFSGSADEDDSIFSDEDSFTVASLYPFRDDGTIATEDGTYLSFVDTVASSVDTRKGRQLDRTRVAFAAEQNEGQRETSWSPSWPSSPPSSRRGDSLLQTKDTESPVAKGILKSPSIGQENGFSRQQLTLQESATDASKNMAGTAATRSDSAPGQGEGTNSIKILDRLQSVASGISTENSASSRSTKKTSNMKQQRLSLRNLVSMNKNLRTSGRPWNRVRLNGRSTLSNIEGEETLLESRDDAPPTESRMPELFDIPEEGERDARISCTEEAGAEVSSKSKMGTMAPFANAVGNIGTALNVKKIKARHDAIKRANGIEDDAKALSETNQWGIAEKKYMEALRIKREVLRDDDDTHDEIIKTLDLLGMSRMEQGNFAGAIQPVEEALAARRRAKGSDHPQVVNQLHSLAFLCRISGDTTRLLKVQEEIQRVCRIPSL